MLANSDITLLKASLAPHKFGVVKSTIQLSYSDCVPAGRSGVVIVTASTASSPLTLDVG